MKKHFIAAFTLVIFCLSANATVEINKPSIIKGTMKDARNNIIYNTIKVNGKTWMAQNLNFAYDSSYCYDDKKENCDKYGRLYDWESANKVCPQGWHLPSDREWDELTKSLSGMSLADSSWHGDASSGFNVLAAGYRDEDEDYDFIGTHTYFWSSTKKDKSNYWLRILRKEDPQFLRYFGYHGHAISVRCIKN